MAVTASPRLALTRWSDDAADSLTRSQLDGDHGRLDSNVAMYVQVANLAAMPAPGKVGRFCWVQTVAALFYDDGATWQIQLNPPAASGAPPVSHPGDTAVVGSAFAWSPQDHRHAREGWGGSGDVATVTAGSGGPGATGRVSDAGHQHVATTGGPGVSYPNDAAAAGAGTALALASHVHGRETTQVATLANLPGAPYVGQLVVVVSPSRFLYVWDGVAWHPVTSGGLFFTDGATLAEGNYTSNTDFGFCGARTFNAPFGAGFTYRVRAYAQALTSPFQGGTAQISLSSGGANVASNRATTVSTNASASFASVTVRKTFVVTGGGSFTVQPVIQCLNAVFTFFSGSPFSYAEYEVVPG